MKKFLLIELPDDGGGGDIGGCIGVVFIVMIILAAILYWPKMFIELANGTAGNNTETYLIIIACSLIPSIIVECVKKEASFAKKYLINTIIFAVLMIVITILSTPLSLILLIGAAFVGAMISLVPTAVLHWIGKAIRK